MEVVADFVDGEAFRFEEVAGGGEGVCANEALVSPDESLIPNWHQRYVLYERL